MITGDRESAIRITTTHEMNCRAQPVGISAPRRAPEDLCPVKLEKLLLFPAELSNLRRPLRIDAELHRTAFVRHRRDEQPAFAERDEAAVEQEVGLWREHQAVVAAQAFVVARVAPGFDVARDQIRRIRHARDAAGLLDARDVLAEQALAATRLDQCRAFDRTQTGDSRATDDRIGGALSDRYGPIIEIALAVERAPKHGKVEAIQVLRFITAKKRRAASLLVSLDGR